MVGVLAFGVAGLVWLVIPFLDPRGEGRISRLITGAGVFGLAYILVFTIYGYLAK